MFPLLATSRLPRRGRPARSPGARGMHLGGDVVAVIGHKPDDELIAAAPPVGPLGARPVGDLPS